MSNLLDKKAKPIKPKNSTAWYILRMGSALGLLVSLLWNAIDPNNDFKFIAAVFGFLVLFLILFGKKHADYYIAKANWEMEEQERQRKLLPSKTLSGVEINNNINQYKKEQQLRKANRKWWEFWI